jgi:hypothetical protein
VDQTYPNVDALWPKGKVTFQVAISRRLLAIWASLAEGDGGVPVVFSFRGGEGEADHPIEFEVPHKNGSGGLWSKIKQYRTARQSH